MPSPRISPLQPIYVNHYNIIYILIGLIFYFYLFFKTFVLPHHNNNHNNNKDMTNKLYLLKINSFFRIAVISYILYININARLSIELK
jgi:magnesium-transporting ATPase (P-type)